MTETTINPVGDRYVVYGDHLCQAVTDCTCDNADVNGCSGRPNCGIVPIASIAEVLSALAVVAASGAHRKQVRQLREEMSLLRRGYVAFHASLAITAKFLESAATYQDIPGATTEHAALAAAIREMLDDAGATGTDRDVAAEEWEAWLNLPGVEAALGEAREQVRQLREELERQRTWAGLMSLLDEYYPEIVFDGSSGDSGPRIIALTREVDRLRDAITGAAANFRVIAKQVQECPDFVVALAEETRTTLLTKLGGETDV